MGTMGSACVVGDLICVMGQLLPDCLSMTPTHVLSSPVVAGAVLDGLGWYEPLLKFAGATVPTLTAPVFHPRRCPPCPDAK
ncbi:SpoVA protein [Melghirimyces profundicolus]|uniref:SpoVA protein n=1 Tax=Melghirimyces profundicolus TaxID=1242148 RepID=A0A2T6B462_9BACL|nr:SpoVA protein [Melghirimyces profundicolus]